MKKTVLIVLFLCLLATARAQHVGGLWQGKWSSPEGYVFDFVMQIDEFADGSIEGFFTWTFVAAPPNDWYYKNKQGLQAIEYVSGKIPENGKINVEGYKKDDPNAIIALDSYQLNFNESFSSFTGTSGHHGTWDGKLEGVRAKLP